MNKQNTIMAILYLLDDLEENDNYKKAHNIILEEYITQRANSLKKKENNELD